MLLHGILYRTLPRKKSLLYGRKRWLRLHIAMLIMCVAISNTSHSMDQAANGSHDKDAAQSSVRRLLTVRCSGCHNSNDKKGGLDLTTAESMLAGGDSGPSLVPGKLDESSFWQRIADDEMPPKKPLPQDERELVRKWILDNAKWTGGKLDPAEFTSEERAGYDWWSLQPLQNNGPPESENSANPIDAFIRAKLKSAGLKPSRRADRRTLARRIAVDLTGLPPAPNDVIAMAADSSEQAVERWIDRMLESPAYGERWARYWLDTVRFGESHGFERDQLRTNSWRYRDWVVDAFNRDLPYDVFCQQQLAGDALAANDASAVIATGMLVCGPYDQVGQTQQSAAMRAVVRQDELEDLVSVVGQTFLGLTVNCSRCHDHKFDPIPMREYYQLCAVLAGTHHGERDIDQNQLAVAKSALLPRIENRIKALEQRIEGILGPVRTRLLAAKETVAAKVEPPQPMARWEFDDLKDSVGGLDLQLQNNASLQDGHLHIEGLGFAQSVPLSKTLHEKTLEVWVKLKNISQQAGAAISVESEDGVQFDAIVYAELEPNRWMAGSDGFSRTDSFQSNEPEKVAGELVHMVYVYEKNGSITAYRNGIPYGKPIRKSDSIAFGAGKSHVLFGLRHLPAFKSKILECDIERASLYDRALNESEVAASAGGVPIRVSLAEIERDLGESTRSALEEMRFELTQLIDQRRRANDAKVYSVVSTEPQKTFVLDRGNPAAPRQEVAPSGIAALVGLSPDLQLEPTATDAQRRLQLAKWISDPRNAIFARVIVNRVWQFHFGVGIVDTPNDFGFNGGRPSHPELLDWLARDLIEHGWSLKHLHRRIMTSETYQQSSKIDPDMFAKDSSNRFLWRKSPIRLDAESMRDTMVELAGELDHSIGGPGLYDFSLYINNSHFYAMKDPIGESFQRRALYRTWVRSARSNLLDVFDCPDPSTKTPQRPSTTTPLQSLSLLNNSFVLRMADHWAERVKAASGNQLDQQIKAMFLQAFYREPSSEELEGCMAMADKYGLSSVSRVLLNSNELLYVD